MNRGRIVQGGVGDSTWEGSGEGITDRRQQPAATLWLGRPPDADDLYLSAWCLDRIAIRQLDGLDPGSDVNLHFATILGSQVPARIQSRTCFKASTGTYPVIL